MGTNIARPIKTSYGVVSLYSLDGEYDMARVQYSDKKDFTGFSLEVKSQMYTLKEYAYQVNKNIINMTAFPGWCEDYTFFV